MDEYKRIIGIDPGPNPVFSSVGLHRPNGDNTWEIVVENQPLGMQNRLDELTEGLRKTLSGYMGVPSEMIVSQPRRCGKQALHRATLELRENQQGSVIRWLKSWLPHLSSSPMSYDPNTKLYRYRLWSGVIRGHRISVSKVFRIPDLKLIDVKSSHEPSV